MKRNRPTPRPAAVLNVAAFLAVLLLLGAASLLGEKPVVSQVEKRMLAQKPVFSIAALLRGSYTDGLALYFADTFVWREGFVRLANRMVQWRGFEVGEGRLYANAAADADAAQAEAAFPVKPDNITEQKPAQTDPLPAPSSAQVEEKPVRNGAIFVYRDTGYPVFGGNDKMGQSYAKTLSFYEEKLGEHIRIYNLVVPSSTEFGMPARYRSMTTAQLPKLQNIANALHEGIEWVDVYDTLAQHSDEYLYFRTDHHWTALGAYYAYRAFAEQAGFAPLALDDMQPQTLPDFLGSYYTQTQSEKMQNHPDTLTYYLQPAQYHCNYYLRGSPDSSVPMSLFANYARDYNCYSVFMHGDQPVVDIQTAQQNGRRIAVVKESYGNAFIPFLINHYERVVVIDQRYLEKGFYEVLDNFRINELLFINNISAAYTPVRIRELGTLPVRVYVPPVCPAGLTDCPADESCTHCAQNLPDCPGGGDCAHCAQQQADCPGGMACTHVIPQEQNENNAADDDQSRREGGTP